MSESGCKCSENAKRDHSHWLSRFSNLLSQNLALGSFAVLLLNIVGFLLVIMHFGPRGVPIEAIGFGSRTVLAATLTLFFPFILLVLVASAWEAGKALATVLPKLWGYANRKFRKRDSQEESSEEPNLKVLVREDPRAFVFALLAPLFPMIFALPALILPQVFFGNLGYNPIDSVCEFRFCYVIAICAIGLWHYSHQRHSTPKKSEREPALSLSSEAPPDTNALATMIRLRNASGAVFAVMLFAFWCLLFLLGLYPKMRPEFGGGMPQVVTMYFANGRLDQLNLGDPPASMPDSKMARRVRIIYETDQDYRISPAIEQDPPVIYKVNKQDVTLVVISAQDWTP
jgi:hypothetical protein